MSIISRNATAARPEQFAGDERISARQSSSEGIGEGLGVFRALFFMLVLYVGLGSLVWFAWHAWHGHSH